MEAGVLAALLTLIGVLVTVLVATLPKAIRNAAAVQLVETLKAQATALREEIDDMERRGQETTAEYQQKVTELQAKVNALTDTFAKEVVDRAVKAGLPRWIADAVIEELHERREANGHTAKE